MINNQVMNELDKVYENECRFRVPCLLMLCVLRLLFNFSFVYK